MKTCKVDDCDKPLYGKGYCKRHWQHISRHGHIINTPYERHGMTNHPLYNIWLQMNERCRNKKNRRYHHYGGNGITVCDRWRYSFSNFLTDMGERPSENHSLERVNLNGGYNPSNCIWTDNSSQMINRRFIGGLSGLRGVQQNTSGKTYFLLMQCEGKRFRMSGFADPVDAAYVYDQLMIGVHGDNLQLNFLGKHPRYESPEAFEVVQREKEVEEMEQITGMEDGITDEEEVLE